MSDRKHRKAFSTLPTILLLGGIIIEIAIAVTFLFQLFGSTHFAARLSSEAFTVAQAGIEDAIIRVTRNKSCGAIAGCPSSYELSVGDRTASITICKDCDEIGKTRVEAIGSAQTQRRKLQAILTVDPITGDVDIDSISEVAL